MRAVVVNAGNANCATGILGDAVAFRTNEEAAPPHAARAARGVCLLDWRHRRATSGRKNSPCAFRRFRVIAALPRVPFAELSLAICHHRHPAKNASASFKMAGKRIHVVGCSKGAGMIHPNMATTLAFVVTDAAISPSLLQRTLSDITSRTFNSISVDGDTSTNDTAAGPG